MTLELCVAWTKKIHAVYYLRYYKVHLDITNNYINKEILVILTNYMN